MVIVITAILIFAISFYLALKSADKELRAPDEVVNLKIAPRNRNKISGVILFLKGKIVHLTK